MFCGMASYFRAGEYCESTWMDKFLLRDLWDSRPGIYARITRQYQLGSLPRYSCRCGLKYELHCMHCAGQCRPLQF